MHLTRIDLPEPKRATVTRILNERLAELIDLKLQIKQAHWNVKGPNFISLHKLFDEFAGTVEEQIDETAERITALGGTAEGTLAAVASRTSLPAYSVTLTSGRGHIDALASAMAAVGKVTRLAIDETAGLGDADSADLLTGISRELDKQLWFLEAHLQSAE